MLVVRENGATPFHLASVCRLYRAQRGMRILRVSHGRDARATSNKKDGQLWSVPLNSEIGNEGLACHGDRRNFAVLGLLRDVRFDVQLW
jgi:hypothetical protein